MLIKPRTTSTGKFTVALPPDKSLTHRAIILASCAKGDSTIVNASPARDCQTTATVMQQLGVTVHGRERLQIKSLGKELLRSPHEPLDCGNSGTTARLLLGLLSSLPQMVCTCCGDESLSARPMGRVVRWLRQAGAHIEGEQDGERLPLTIRGKQLQPFNYTLPTASAQVKSALLLAAMNIEGQIELDLPAGTRMHTEHMLQQQGIPCQWHTQAGRQYLSARGPYAIRPQTWHITADPSAATFFVVLALLMPPEVSIVLPNVMADDNRLSYLNVIAAMGGEVQRRAHDNGACELVVQGGAQLRATEISAEAVPSMIDEIPALAVLALFATGTTIWHGIGELRTKESDRLAAIVRLGVAAGRAVETHGDDLSVSGSNAPVNAFSFDAQHDHRLSMAAAVCASMAPQPCTLEKAECADISFPSFFDQLYAVTQGE